VPIINLSWSGPRPSAVLDAAIGESGALVVAAAGNGGDDLDASGGRDRSYPASFDAPNLIAVAASDRTGNIATFSDIGVRSVDLAAPGTDILGPYPRSAGCPDPCLVWSGGTSVAAAMVSGVAALVGSRRPALLTAPLALRVRLLATARPMAAMIGLTATGRMIDADRATDPDR
jgi:subtilisin family serine protease